MTYNERRFFNRISISLIAITVIVQIQILHETNYSPNFITTISNIISFLHTDFFEKLLIAFVAAFSGFYSQKIFKDIDERKTKIKEAGKFNEAIFYTSILIENIGSELEQLVLKNYNSEQEIFKILQSAIKNHQQPPKFSFFSFQPTEVAKEKNLLEKIPDLGNYPELAQAFYRVRSAMINFNRICEDRNILIKSFLENNKTLEDPENFFSRLKEIIQRTYLSLIQGETILDGLIYITEQLSEVHDVLVTDFKMRGTKGVRVSKLPKHPVWYAFTIRLRDMLDEDEDLRERHLHLRPRKNA